MSTGDVRNEAIALLAELAREMPPEEAPPRRFSDAALLDLVLGRAELSQRRRLALMLSPADRQRLAELRQLERARVLQRWRAARRPTPTLSLRAAADDRVRPLDMAGEGFSLRLIPFDLEGRLWKIALRIAPELVADTPVGFRLEDSEGLVWVRGHADAAGQLVGFWERDEALLERLQRVELRLLPR